MSSGSENIVVLPFLTIDIDAVFELWGRTDHLAIQETDTPHGVGRFLHRNPETCFIAKINETVVGAILCGNDGRRGHIYHLAVGKGYRRQGIASMLLAEALSVLESMGISRCYAAMYNDNPYRDLFWMNHGWEFRDERLVFMYNRLKPKSDA